MSTPPAAPKIYHITHHLNLSAILSSGTLCSDFERINQNLTNTNIGMSTIKQRRLSLPVQCRPNTTVGQYVPFYFCPRSVMLYLLHRGNHSELNYAGGQAPIVHLQADLRRVVGWAEQAKLPWTFTPSNAGAFYTQHYRDLQHLNQVDWTAVGASDFRPSAVKEGKQAEFLLFQQFPVQLIERIGVANQQICHLVTQMVQSAQLAVPVRVEPTWYY